MAGSAKTTLICTRAAPTLRAALDTLSVATDAFGREGYQVLFAELRRVFGL